MQPRILQIHRFSMEYPSKLLVEETICNDIGQIQNGQIQINLIQQTVFL